MKFSKSFICANQQVADFDNQLNAPLFRKAFSLDKIPQSAVITICGAGFYELYVNGKNVTKGAMSPYIYNPDQVCYYDTYNVADCLQTGKNVIGVILGNGFRNAYGGFVWDFHTAACRGAVTFALSCELDDICFESDLSFKTHPSPILRNDLRMGYAYDARLELPNWNLPDFDDSSWDNAQFCQKPPLGEPKLCNAPPVSIIKTLKPISVTFHEEMSFGHYAAVQDARVIESTRHKNVYLFDFGQNLSGITTLHVKNARPGQKITVRHGELLVNGEFSISNIMFTWASQEWIDRYLKYCQCDEFICKGGDETFVPKFTYNGFRYAYVEGLLSDQLDDDTLTYLVQNSNVRERATFNSSNEILNSLFQMTRNSTLSNMVHIPTDCPHREKNGWTGDVSISAEHFLLNTDCVDFLDEWLYSVSKAQTQQGDLPAIIPTGTWGYGAPYAGPVWDSVCVNVPYYLYKYTGNADYIRKYADMIMRYFDYLQTRLDNRGLYTHGLGDWTDPFRRYRDGYLTNAPEEVTSSIAVYEMQTRAAFLFDRAGLTDFAKKCRRMAQQLRKNIRKNFIDDDCLVYGDCQTTQAYAIATGILNDDEQSRAKQVLLKMLRHDKLLTCGIIGRRVLFDLLSDMGEWDLAVNLVVSKDVTSYGGWVDGNNTTLLENFNPYATVQDSLNHHFQGDISRWMVERIAGLRINPTCCDCNSFVIHPTFPASISFAEASYDYGNGILKCSWKRHGEDIQLCVFVPDCCHGKVVIPDGYITNDDCKLSVGEYTFFVKKSS